MRNHDKIAIINEKPAFHVNCGLFYRKFKF